MSESVAAKIPCCPGLWFDADVRGRFTDAAIIRLAYDAGWRGSNYVTTIMEEYDPSTVTCVLDDLDHRLAEIPWYNECADAAEDWLREHLAIPDGHFLGRLECGSFGVFEDEEDNDG